MAKVDRIMVEDDSGKRQYILKITPQLRADSLSGRGTVDGLCTYETKDGQECDVDGDSFVVVGTGKRLSPC